METFVDNEAVGSGHGRANGARIPRLESFRRGSLPRLRDLVDPQAILALADPFGMAGNGNGHGAVPGGAPRGPMHNAARNGNGAATDLCLVIVARAFSGREWLDRRVWVSRECGVGPGVRLLCYTPGEFERRLSEPGLVHRAATRGVDLLAGENHAGENHVC